MPTTSGSKSFSKQSRLNSSEYCVIPFSKGKRFFPYTRIAVKKTICLSEKWNYCRFSMAFPSKRSTSSFPNVRKCCNVGFFLGADLPWSCHCFQPILTRYDEGKWGKKNENFASHLVTTEKTTPAPRNPEKNMPRQWYIWEEKRKKKIIQFGWNGGWWLEKVHLIKNRCY